MNVLLRKITIKSDENIKVPHVNIKKCWWWFNKPRVIRTLETEYATYEYWIEFHIDQGRFYYGERKPVESNTEVGIYTYQTNTSHTKRGLDKSLEIITEINNRTEILFPEWNIALYQIPNISIYRQFDKEQ